MNSLSLTWVVTGVAYHLSVIVLYFKAPSKDTLLVYYPGVNSLQLFSPGNFPSFPPRTATHKANIIYSAFGCFGKRDFQKILSTLLLEA